jgi:hypothetical protein
MNVHGFATTSHDGNKQQRFVTLPLKPNGQKTWVHTTEYHPIQQSPVMWPSEVHRWSLPELDTLTLSAMVGIK